MSDPSANASSPDPLSLVELRLLGVLIEKQKTTPDVYPMTVNGLIVGSNQKSNRDPILQLTEGDVEDCLESLHRKQLVVRVQSGRVDKWRHVLYEVWNVEKVELAVLAELFLRGPQTEGELRSRVNRMEPIEDLDALRGILHKLAARNFVVYLTPEGRRGTTLSHGFATPELLEQWKKAAGEGDRVEPMSSHIPGKSGENERVLDELRKEVAHLRSCVDTLAIHVTMIAEQLGLSLPAPPPT